jgi:hypothetical protein
MANCTNSSASRPYEAWWSDADNAKLLAGVRGASSSQDACQRRLAKPFPPSTHRRLP